MKYPIELIIEPDTVQSNAQIKDQIVDHCRIEESNRLSTSTLIVLKRKPDLIEPEDI